MSRSLSLCVILGVLGAWCAPARAGDVAIYTGNTSWVDKAVADAQAAICIEKLGQYGIPGDRVREQHGPGRSRDLGDGPTANGDVDVLIIFGYFPESIYPAANASPDGSIAETFIESTDGDAIINHGDWMFYVSSVNNAGDGLANMMDIPGIS